MTRQEKCVRLAEWAGLNIKKFRYKRKFYKTMGSSWVQGFLTLEEAQTARDRDEPFAISDVEVYDDLTMVPNYFKDYNAICELVNKLHEYYSQEGFLHSRLAWIANLELLYEKRFNEPLSSFNIINISTDLRAEALGLALNLWEPDDN